MAVIKLDIGTNIIYNDEEYQIKGYPSLSEVLIKHTKKPFSEKVVKVSTLIKEPRNAQEQSKELVDIDDKEFEKEVLSLSEKEVEDFKELVKNVTVKQDRFQGIFIETEKNRGTKITIIKWLRGVKIESA